MRPAGQGVYALRDDGAVTCIALAFAKKWGARDS